MTFLPSVDLRYFFSYNFTFLKKDFIYLFLDRGEGREKEKEGNINVWLLLTRPLPGTWPATQACPDWELNPRPFVLQAGTQSTEPHQPGIILLFITHESTVEFFLKPGIFLLMLYNNLRTH